MTSENNKRIAKNTLLLYFRMLLIMGVSLFTVRVVLDVLGTVDYGLYNVVGGIVTMFAFLSGAMSTSSQRYFAFELGRKNYDQLKKTFSMTLTIYILIAVVILILAETVGLWFLNHKMTIPSERMEAANWVYQFSIFSFMMTMFTIPYNAAIIAHERMNVYAYVSIIEVTLKLLIVYLLVLFSFDKLKLYAILMFSVTTIISFIYRTYCNRKFEECHYVFYWNKSLFYELVSYSGWNLFGAFSGIVKGQGSNIVLNIFFGPTVNAARAIAFQINQAINNFVTNFYQAVRPQIIKYYAEGNINSMLNLIFTSSRFSYYLMFFLSMPVLLNTSFILGLWLKNPPEYAALFTQLIVINTLIDSLATPLMTAAHATGKIKLYQSVVGTVVIMNIPISYLFFKLGYPPEFLFYISIILSVICLVLRQWIVQRLIHSFSILHFTRKVLFIVFFVSIISSIIPIILSYHIDKGIVKFLISSSLHVVCSLVTIYFIGITYTERKKAFAYISKFRSRILKR